MFYPTVCFLWKVVEIRIELVTEKKNWECFIY